MDFVLDIPIPEMVGFCSMRPAKDDPPGWFSLPPALHSAVGQKLTAVATVAPLEAIWPRCHDRIDGLAPGEAGDLPEAVQEAAFFVVSEGHWISL